MIKSALRNVGVVQGLKVTSAKKVIVKFAILGTLNFASRFLSDKRKKPDFLSVTRTFRLSQKFYASSASASSKPDARQIELMARSLPHRKMIKDVGHIIVVASGKGWRLQQ